MKNLKNRIKELTRRNKNQAENINKADFLFNIEIKKIKNEHAYEITKLRKKLDEASHFRSWSFIRRLRYLMTRS
jgi:hypothetical protein